MKGCESADGKVTERKGETPVQVISPEAPAETRKQIEAMATGSWIASDAAVAG